MSYYTRALERISDVQLGQVTGLKDIRVFPPTDR